MRGLGEYRERLAGVQQQHVQSRAELSSAVLTCLTDCDGDLGEEGCWGGQTEALPVPQCSPLPCLHPLLEIILGAPLPGSQGGGVAVPGPDHARGEGRGATRRLQS